MKKILRAAVSALLACVLFCGCSAKNGGGTPAEVKGVDASNTLVGAIPVTFPLTKEPKALNILITSYAGSEQEDVYVWKKYEEMTGVKTNWTEVTKETRAEKLHSVLTNGQSMDIIMRCKISATRLTQYGKSGLILDLAKDDMLKKYAPNCWAYLEAHPDTMASIMNPDGTIYALPQVNSGAELRVALKLFVNKSWLERVNMKLPKTTDEFRKLLEAFKTQDANGNGNANDEIPFCSSSWQSVYESMYGAFGLANRGIHNGVVDYDPQTGVRYIPTTDAYKSCLEYLHGLYKDGLLDRSVFTITDSQWRGNAVNDSVGVFASTNLAALPGDGADNWVAIEEALEGPNGDKLWTPIRANFHSTGAAVIPATCREPELALRWLDYFWTDEGTLFYHMGVEGETFVAKDDGTYDYAQKLYDEIAAGGHTFDDVVAKYSPYPGGSNPTVEIAPYFRGGEMAEVPARAARELFKYGPSEYWPSFTFTQEESERLDTLRLNIDKYQTATAEKFVTGEKPLSEWNEYKAQLENMGAEELLKIYRAALERYNTLVLK